MGDYILLNMQNLPLKMVATKKLAPLWVGPYQVLEVVNSNAYKLALPNSLCLLQLVLTIVCCWFILNQPMIYLLHLLYLLCLALLFWELLFE